LIFWDAKTCLELMDKLLNSSHINTMFDEVKEHSSELLLELLRSVVRIYTFQSGSKGGEFTLIKARKSDALSNIRFDKILINFRCSFIQKQIR